MNYIQIVKERKIIDGKLYRKYFIDTNGKEIGIPTGVSCGRHGGRYYVNNSSFCKRFCHIPAIHRSYHDKYSQEQAYMQVIAHMAQYAGKELRTCIALDHVKRAPKHEFTEFDNTKLPVGVCAIRRTNGSVVITSVYYDKDYSRFKTKVLYCGTANTWRANFQKVLEKAVALREDSLKEYLKLIN